jgi:hypothetical protein
MMVKCPRHEDHFPSCKVYADGAYCFAGCGKIPLSEIGMEVHNVPPKPKENLAEKLAYINSLPGNNFRGFVFPYDARGFYICWPDALYYKLRLFDPTARSRYLGPAGYKAPLFWARRKNRDKLMVIEGELEALSAAAALPEWDVVSPGGTASFADKSYLTQYLNYTNIVIVVDNDGAGVKAARSLGLALLYRVPFLQVLYKSVEADFNDVLVRSGKEALREEIERCLQEGVPWSAP